MTASRIPPPLARRLDRLAARAHRFHRHAHHPLCEAYAGEVVRLGRRARVCRGCALAALGGAAGLALGAAVPGVPGPAVLAGAVAAAPFIASVARLRDGGRAPALPSVGRAHPKLLTRLAPALAAAAGAALGLRARSLPGLVAAALLAGAVGWTVRAYRRRGPDRRACAGCEERSRPVACSGFAPIARREAAFARLAGRLLREAPPPPRA